jgi:hypothetical protein
MALAGGRAPPPRPSQKEHSDPAEPCLPSQRGEHVQKARLRMTKAVIRASLVAASGTISRL